MIGCDGLGRRQKAVGNGTHVTHHFQRPLRRIDLSPEQGNPRAILLGLVYQLEAVARRAGTAAEYADHHVRIKARQFLERLGAVVGDLQEARLLLIRQAGETADDGVVDEGRHVIWRQSWHVGVEHLQEVAEAQGKRFLAEGRKGLKGGPVGIEIVVEGNRVETEVGVSERSPDRRRAEWS